MLSIFAVTITPPARRTPILAAGLFARFAFCSGSIELATRTLSIGSTSIARPAISPATFPLIFACVFGVTLARRRFAHPRRQHFEVDQFVEFDRRVRHRCFLR